MRTPYVEVVLDGTLEAVQGAFQALRDALGEWAGHVYFSEKVGIQGESRVHQFLEKLHLAENETHVLVPLAVWPVVEKNATAFETAGCALKGARTVVETRFRFSFCTYNREHGALIEAILHSAVDDVKLEGYESEKTDNPEEKPGLYTPVHGFEFRGKGRFTGPVEGLVRIHTLAENEPLIELDEIEIVLGDPAAKGASA